jgi:hypothetical protein
VNKISIALLLGAFFAVGCGDKTDGAASGSAKASSAPAKSGSAAAASSGAAATTGTAAAAGGSKVCDEYWAKVEKCNAFALKAMPDGAAKDDMKKQQEEGMKKSKEAWKSMQGDALDGVCKQSLEAMAATKCE